MTQNSSLRSINNKKTEKIKSLKWTGDVKYMVIDYVDKIEEYAKKVEALLTEFKSCISNV